MRLITRLFALLLLLSVITGCGLIYQPNIQQGNVLDEEDVAKLEPGLTKAQVVALLGQPSVTNLFNRNRWDYVSTLQVRGGEIETRSLTLYFDNGVLARTEGEFFAEDSEQMLEDVQDYPSIIEDGDDDDESEPTPPIPQPGDNRGDR